MNAISKFLTASVAAAAVLAGASAANAATNFTQVNLINGSSIFGATTDEGGEFTHSFNFTTDVAALASGSVVTISLEGDRDIDFSSIDLDGFAFAPKSADPVESWGLVLAGIGAGPHTITLKGTVAATPAAQSASYAGTLNITAVPEPATWGLMIMGFGGAGAMVRSRRRAAAAA